MTDQCLRRPGGPLRAGRLDASHVVDRSKRLEDLGNLDAAGDADGTGFRRLGCAEDVGRGAVRVEDEY